MNARAVAYLLSILLYCIFAVPPLGASILIIAPHPDDDLLYASGIVYEAVRSETPIRVVFVTNGDYTGTAAGFTRQAEAVAGQGRLGLDEDSLIFLGYPDGYLWNVFHEHPNEGDSFVAPHGQALTYGNRGLGRVDYHSYRWGSPATYNRHNMVADLEEILLSHRPEHIITTAEFDNHADHYVTYHLLRLALTGANQVYPWYDPAIYKTMVHWQGGGWPEPIDPESYFSEPPNFSDRTGLEWDKRASLDLLRQAINPKINALSEHRSQGGTGGFLGGFVHKDEVFWVERLFGGDPPPVTHAGFDQVVGEGGQVLLDGAMSSSGNGNPLSFLWSQVDGPPVDLTGAASMNPQFTAPERLTADEYLVFRLVVEDGDSVSLPDFVHVRVVASNPYPNIAPLANVIASSENTGTGQLGIKAVDGVIDGWPGDSTREWTTQGERAGAWLELEWQEPYFVNRVVFYDRPNANDQILKGNLLFSDGSNVEIEALTNTGRGQEFVFPERAVSSVRFVVGEVSGTTQNVGLAEIEVFGVRPQGDGFPLAIAYDPPWSGTVARTPDRSYYEAGSEVTLEATAAAGYVFSFWSGDVSGTQNPLSVAMDGSKSLTAHFAAMVETVSPPVVPEGPASGTVGEVYSYSSGGAVSSLGNPVEYQFDWGDGRVSAWSSAALASTAWAAAGTYAVRARARSATDTAVVSDWSAPLSVVLAVERVAHTVATSPAGLQIVVDGVTYTAPQTFDWEVGSSHTLSAPSPQGGDAGTRQVFASWSDGGAQTRTVTAASAPVTFTAAFATQYSLSVAVTPTEGGVVSPSGVTWRAAGEVVSLEATAAAGYVFSFWSGDVSGTQNPLSVTMDGSKGLTAHFVGVPGSIDVSPESSADFEGRAGGPFRPNRLTYTLTNNGGVPVTWRVSNNASWLSISTTSGVLEPGSSQDVTLSIVNRETRNLAVGTYTDTVTFENLDNVVGTTTRQVNLTIIRR